MEYEKICEKFIKHAVIHGKCNESGDYRKGNRSSDALYKIEKDVLLNQELRERLIDDLINYQNANVQIWICGMAIDAKYRKIEAEEILKKLSQDKLGIHSFNAKMTLEVSQGKWNSGDK